MDGKDGWKRWMDGWMDGKFIDNRVL